MATIGLQVKNIVFIFPATWVSDDKETKERKRRIWDETNSLYLRLTHQQRLEKVANESL